MSAADASSLNLWSALSLLGFILVIFGVLLEGVEAFISTFSWFRRKRFSIIWNTIPEPHIPRWAHRLDHIGWFIQVIGLALETWGHIRVTDITGRENRRLIVKLDSTTQIAGAAIESAARLQLQVAQTESNNLSLKIQLEELRAENARVARMSLPKWLNFDEAKFIDALVGKPKASVEVIYPKNDSHASSLAEEIVEGLLKSSWNVIGFREVQADDAINPIMLSGKWGFMLGKSGPESVGYGAPTRELWQKMPFTVQAGADSETIALVGTQIPFSHITNGFDTSTPLRGMISAIFLSQGVNPIFAVAGRYDSRIPTNELKIVIGQRF